MAELSEQEEELYSCEEELSCGQEEEEEELYSCEELSFGQEEELSCEDEEKGTAMLAGQCCGQCCGQEEAVTQPHESLSSLLTSEDRDFLIRNNGQQVKVEELAGKYVGLLFSAYWWPCTAFTPVLSEVYNKLSVNEDFEIVYVSFDKNEESFKENHDKMPWLAVPFSDKDSRNKLGVEYQVYGIPSLILLDKEGRVITDDGVNIIEKYGVEGYPFTAERLAVDSLKRQVPVAELAGKTVGLFFSAHWCPPCRNFTPVLSEIYEKLSENGDFEIVFVSGDSDEKSFQEYHDTMPWLALPFSDRNLKIKLEQAFQIDRIPSLIILDKEGRVITTEGVDIIRKYDVEGCSFTAERLDELRSKEEPLTVAQTVESLLLSDERDYLIRPRVKAKRKPRAAQTGETVIESLLLTDERDYLLRNRERKKWDEDEDEEDQDEEDQDHCSYAQAKEDFFLKVPVKELAGKTVGLFFSEAHVHGFSFTDKVIDIYNELKEKGEAFEIVFISYDDWEDDFIHQYSGMPWLALPMEDRDTQIKLSRYFRVSSSEAFAIIGPDGETVLQADAYDIIENYGMRAYPFTKERLEEIEAEDKAKREAEEIEAEDKAEREAEEIE